MRPVSPGNLTAKLQELIDAIHDDCAEDKQTLRACIYELNSLRRANAELMIELHMSELDHAAANEEEGLWIN